MAELVEPLLRLPSRVPYQPGESIEDFWRRRLYQHTTDRYKGRLFCKMPEDARVYQHVIDASRPDTVVELGTFEGGSAIWFADQLRTFCGGGKVITLDVIAPVPEVDDPRVVFIHGDLAELSYKVADLVVGRRVMVVDDSAHTLESTSAALRLYGPLVSSGCWFVVEDGIVDEPVSVWPGRGGVQPAIDEFLRTPDGGRFTRHDLAVYGLTTDIGGWLEAR